MKAIVILMVMMTTAASVYGQSAGAVIREVRGEVEIKAPGSSVWTAAAAGQALEEETLISTGFKSTALIGIGTSALLVRPLTRLSLGSIRRAADTEQVDIRLRAGRVRAEVKPPAAGVDINFAVRSPMVTASVRGTIFEFDAVNLAVEEGVVHFSGADKSAVYVGAGQSSSPDPVSGKTAAAVETAAAQALPPPAGVAEAVSVPAVIPGPVPQAPVRVGIQWVD
jgi:hypothetical protein